MSKKLTGYIFQQNYDFTGPRDFLVVLNEKCDIAWIDPDDNSVTIERRERHIVEQWASWGDHNLNVIHDPHT